MAKSILKILTEYFNVGDGKRPLKAWAAEISELSEPEKHELAEGVCAITGETIAE